METRITLRMFASLVAMLLMSSFIAATLCQASATNRSIDFLYLTRYGIEVVLNKPGVSIDMEKFKEFLGYVGAVHTVEDIDGFKRDAWVTTMLYNNTPVIVQFEFQRLTCREGATRYLAIRVQDLVNISKVEERYMLKCSVNQGYDVIAEKLRELGFNEVSVSRIDDTVRAVYRGRVSNANVILHVECRSESVISTSPLEKSVAAKLARLLSSKLGCHVDIKPVEVKIVKALHQPDVLKRVLKDVLTLLIDYGVVKGLDEQDVNKISSVAKLGYAGWNMRLVYSLQHKGWVPYREVLNEFGGCLVRAPLQTIDKALERLENILKVVESKTTELSQVAHSQPLGEEHEAFTVGAGEEEHTNQFMLAFVYALTASIITGIIVWVLSRRM